MTIQLTYPGVYVEPIISPAPGDAGVATSLAAFVGRTPMGPVNEPVMCFNYGDYENHFGGLNQDSTISYSVKQFFDNGGTQCYVVRCFAPNINSAASVQSVNQFMNGLPNTLTQLTDASSEDDIDAALTAYAQTQMGVKAWAVTHVQTIFKAKMLEAKAAAPAPKTPPKTTDKNTKTPAAADPAAPKAYTVFVQTCEEYAPLEYPAFTGLMNVNPANAANTIVDDIFLPITDLAAVVPTQRNQVLISAKSAMSPYTAGLGQSIATALYQAMEGAGVTPNSAGLNVVINAGLNVPQILDSQVLEKFQSLKSWQEFIVSLLGKDATTTKSPIDDVLTAMKTLSGKFAPSGTWVDAYTVDASSKAITFNWPTADALVSGLTAPTDKSSVVYKDMYAAAGVAAAPYKGKKGTTSVQDAQDLAVGLMKIIVAMAKAVAESLDDNWPASEALQLVAANPGSWANDALTVSIDTTGITASVATAQKQPQDALFNVTVQYVKPSGSTQSESFPNVTLNKTDNEGNQSSNYLPTVLQNASMLVRVKDADSLPSDAPMAGSAATASGGGDSDPLQIDDYIGDEAGKAGVYALNKVEIFNILVVPPDDANGDQDNLVYSTAAEYCVNRNAMLIVDPPVAWAQKMEGGNTTAISINDISGFTAPAERSSAVYFPRVIIEDELLNGAKRVFPPSGIMAGQWAAADTEVGVWKAPAGLEAALGGVAGLEVTMNNDENGLLNPQGINCLRTFTVGGTVAWGARTMRGADALADEYRYIPVRRLLLYIMDWLEVNTKWAVFQDNDEKLWSELRLQIGSFLTGLYKQGALFGSSPDKAYFVRCDASTTTPEDIQNGIVKVEVGFAPVHPAEFVVITVEQITQSAGS